MILSIKSVLKKYGIDGDIILYREEHRKKGLCEYLASKLKDEIGSKTVCTTSDGAFGLYMARALPLNKVVTCCYILSHDYGDVMLKTNNLEVVEGMFVMSNKDRIEKFAKEHDYYLINQFNNPLILEYYYNYFDKLVEQTKKYKINCFCDCSHTGATISGFKKRDLELKTGWKFIVGVNREVGQFANYSKLYEEYFEQETATNYNTGKLGEELEKLYPEFGNVYEATRSISSAMSYLVKHPRKTILIWVGEAFEKESDKFNMYSKSQVSSAEMRVLHCLFDSLGKRDTPSIDVFENYYNEVEQFFETDECKKYIFSFVMSNTIKYFQRYGGNDIYDSRRLANMCKNLRSVNKYIEKEDTDLFYNLIECIVKLSSDDTTSESISQEMFNLYINYKGNDLILKAEFLFIMEMMFANDPTFDFEKLEYIHSEMDSLRDDYRRLHFQLYKCGENFLKKVL